jgi:hypothetical protein
MFSLWDITFEGGGLHFSWAPKRAFNFSNNLQLVYLYQKLKIPKPLRYLHCAIFEPSFCNAIQHLSSNPRRMTLLTRCLL